MGKECGQPTTPWQEASNWFNLRCLKICKAESNCQKRSTRVCQFGFFNSKHKKMQAKVLLISFSGYWSENNFERHCWTLFQRMWGSIQVSFSRKEFHFKLTAIPAQRKGSFVFRGGSSSFINMRARGNTVIYLAAYRVQCLKNTNQFLERFLKSSNN